MRALVLAALFAASVTAWGAASPALAQEDDAVFATCHTCHSLQKGKNGIGPSLLGVYGAKKARLADYSYSPALKAKGGTWTPAELDAFLKSPSTFAPGTKMPMGVPSPEKRATLVAFLAKQK